MSTQLRANTGAMETAGGDISSHLGNVEQFKADARSQFNTIVGNLGDGVGTDQVAAIRQKFEQYLDEHVASLNQNKTSLDKATGTMQQTGKTLSAYLGNNA